MYVFNIFLMNSWYVKLAKEVNTENKINTENVTLAMFC